MHPLTARQPKRALIVEDDSMQAHIIKTMLEAPVPPPVGDLPLTNTARCIYGVWVATWAETLSMATDLLRHNEFDVVLLDMILPDGAREDAVNIVREAAPNVPIIVHSGITDAELVRKLICSDAVSDYIVKGDITSPCALKQRLCHEIDRFHVIREIFTERAESAAQRN